ncbi:MAG: hypothetical protein RBR15_08735 [Sphaerochaeta sp.]|nr:hypothetical protein [Sphaerochaeta sp.]
MDSKKAQQVLDECLQKHQELAGQLKDVGFVWPGSVIKRYLTCGKPNCACHKDPASRHGPYLYWSTKVNGKTVSKAISGTDAKIMQEWVANRTSLESIVTQMKDVAQQAIEAASFLLEEED